MKSSSQITSSQDINNLSHDELKEVYKNIHTDSQDEWFPIMFVIEVCPHCKGEAHQFENYKQNYMQIRCFNDLCEYDGKIVAQFFKSDDFFRMAIALHLAI